MKRHLIQFLIFLMIAFAPFHASAQKDKVDWKDDAITVNEKYFTKMERRQSASRKGPDFAVSGTSGPELFYFRYIIERWEYNAAAHKDMLVPEYEVNFIASGGKAMLPYRGPDGLAKIVVENKLIVNGTLDLDAERRFIQVYNGYYPSTPITPLAPAPTVVVNVNNANPVTGNPAEAAGQAKSKSPVLLNGNDILRDGNLIGKFREGVSESAFSAKMRMVSIYNANGEKVGEAFAPAENPQEWQIKIAADNKELSLLYDSPKELERLFQWMADKGYLVQ